MALMVNLQIFKTKLQNSSKIPNFQNALKTSKYIKNFHVFPNFPNFGAQVFYVFWSLQPFSTDFSERARKMLKNAAFAVKKYTSASRKRVTQGIAGTQRRAAAFVISRSCQHHPTLFNIAQHCPKLQNNNIQKPTSTNITNHIQKHR